MFGAATSLLLAVPLVIGGAIQPQPWPANLNDNPLFARAPAPKPDGTRPLSARQTLSGGAACASTCQVVTEDVSAAGNDIAALCSTTIVHGFATCYDCMIGAGTLGQTTAQETLDDYVAGCALNGYTVKSETLSGSSGSSGTTRTVVSASAAGASSTSVGSSSGSSSSSSSSSDSDSDSDADSSSSSSGSGGFHRSGAVRFGVNGCAIVGSALALGLGGWVLG